MSKGEGFDEKLKEVGKKRVSLKIKYLLLAVITLLVIGAVVFGKGCSP